MPDEDYARDVLGAIASATPLDATGFEESPKTGGNVARLITTVLRARLVGGQLATAKTLDWNGGKVAFKNFAPSVRFWTKVTQADLDGDGDGSRAWACSSVNPEEMKLHVWVLPFSLVRAQYGALPEDRKGRRDLKIILRPGGGWTFKFQQPPDVLPNLESLHREFSLRGVEAFEQARAADAAKQAEDPAPPVLPPVPPDGVNGSDLPADPDPQDPGAVDVPGSNRIYFGPPGTGKSRRLRDELGDARAGGRVRTVTFHPEYTYADFVGSYRPAMSYAAEDGGQYVDGAGQPVPVRGRPAVVYRFVPGPLVEMICAAFLEPDGHFYLVVEEVNRGNCAAIFGDLFQLLDRVEDGESEHAVWVEADLRGHVGGRLGNQPGDARVRFEREGLFIPSNLSIRATMNTSDQSLYPMDSAMKRRWEMQYVPIDYRQAERRQADVNGYGERNWADVLRRLNRQVVHHTRSDDKQIGQWFVRGGHVDAGTFRDKVLSYLWFDVFRHSPQDLFDLGGDPYSYESLVTAYDAGRPVFRPGVLDDAPPPPDVGLGAADVR